VQSHPSPFITAFRSLRTSAAAEGDGMRVETAALLLQHLQGPDVERILALSLQLVVIQRSVAAEGHLRDRVGKIGAVIKARRNSPRCSPGCRPRPR